MRIVFMGSPDFAVPCLEALLETKHQVTAVVTQPDRPKGRGNKLAFTPVKEKALEKGIPVYQPKRVNEPEFIDLLKSGQPDLIVTVAFGQLFKPELLALPPYGCINVHASLLPKYRGAAPIHWAIINGEKETGVTTMYMDRGMDTGDMIIKKSLPILEEDTTGTLHDKLAEAGAELLKETLQLMETGEVPRCPQDHSQATYAALLKREHELIDWARPAEKIYDLIRGMNPWPVAYTTINSGTLKIWETKIAEKESTGRPGQVLEMIKGKGFLVQCQPGSLLLTLVQPQGKRPMSGDEYVRGYRVDKEWVLGNSGK